MILKIAYITLTLVMLFAIMYSGNHAINTSIENNAERKRKK